MLDGGVSGRGLPLAREMHEAAECVRSADVAEVTRPCAARLRCFELEDVCPRRVVRMCDLLQLDVPGAEFEHGFLDPQRWMIAEALVHALAGGCTRIPGGCTRADAGAKLGPSLGGGVEIEMILQTVARRDGCRGRGSGTCLFAHGLLVQWSPPSEAGGGSSRFASESFSSTAGLVVVHAHGAETQRAQSSTWHAEQQAEGGVSAQPAWQAESTPAKGERASAQQTSTFSQV